MTQSIKVLVDAGKASAGPPLGPALGPLGVNVGQVIAQINEKTKPFEGMKVPVEVRADPKTRTFEILTGSPPASQMIMKEIGASKLSSNPKYDKVGNLAIEQVIKVAKSKMDSLNCLSMKSAVKTIIGSCVSIGVLVEGNDPKGAVRDVNEGKYDKEISEERTKVPEEKKKRLETELAEFKARLAKELEELKKEEAEAAAAAGVVEKAPEEAVVEEAPAEKGKGEVKEGRVEEKKKEEPKKEEKK
jgi:large subunit ribosomal protein L11